MGKQPRHRWQFFLLPVAAFIFTLNGGMHLLMVDPTWPRPVHWAFGVSFFLLAGHTVVKFVNEYRRSDTKPPM